MSETPPEPQRLSEGWVDKQIREAQARGEFDNLPGAGKPLKLRHADDPDWFAKSLIERENITGVLPGPMALRKERRELPDVLDELSDEDHVRAVLVDFNKRVRNEVLRSAGKPTSVVVAGVDIEEYVAAWRERRQS